jgi:hypothetical protein
MRMWKPLRASPYPHSLGGDETISEPNLNRESPVMNG